MAVPDFSDSYFTDLSFSWTDNGCILPVRHQEDTYGCYAFCLVDILYSAQYIESEEGPIYKGSEQELIDCVHLLNPKKVIVNHEGVCNTLQDSITFIMRYGLSLEENCPFLGICRQLPNLDAARQPPRRRIFLNDIDVLRYHDLEGHQSTPSDIIGYTRRIEARPVVLAVIAYPSCMDWGVGREVYAGPTQEERDAVAQDALEGKDPRYGFHLLVAVGYGRRNDNIHYLAKNSYGDEWGFHGFIKLEANIRPPFYDQMVELMPSNGGGIKTVFFTKVAPFP